LDITLAAGGCFGREDVVADVDVVADAVAGLLDVAGMRRIS
jgi:hypothetical protein